MRGRSLAEAQRAQRLIGFGEVVQKATKVTKMLGRGGYEMEVSEVRKYHNPWIPAGARELLAAEKGTILDVGGGAAPFRKADHVIDIQPFDAERLRANAWGGEGKAEIRK